MNFSRCFYTTNNLRSNGLLYMSGRVLIHDNVPYCNYHYDGKGFNTGMNIISYY